MSNEKDIKFVERQKSKSMKKEKKKKPIEFDDRTNQSWETAFKEYNSVVASLYEIKGVISSLVIIYGDKMFKEGKYNLLGIFLQNAEISEESATFKRYSGRIPAEIDISEEIPDKYIDVFKLISTFITTKDNLTVIGKELVVYKDSTEVDIDDVDKYINLLLDVTETAIKAGKITEYAIALITPEIDIPTGTAEEKEYNAIKEKFNKLGEDVENMVNKSKKVVDDEKE